MRTFQPILFFVVLGLASPVLGQSEEHAPSEPLQIDPWKGFDEVRLGVLAGLIQPILLRGGNIEADLYYKRLVVGYSHGFLLKLDGATVVGSAKRQGLAFRLPYSTGLSVGYRLLEWLDVRLDAKVHRFEARDEASGQDLFKYTTMTLGFGVYAQYRPFYHFGVDVAPWLEGFVFVTSLRYWPQLWSSLNNDEIEFRSPTTGSDERHRAAEIGIANSPFLFNISFGYLFTF